ncbi:hypothetical protein ACJJTC_007874 [Scirpophaga incertulas]
MSSACVSLSCPVCPRLSRFHFILIALKLAGTLASPLINQFSKFNIDSFLKEVMESQTFDAIADMIAEKAVEKMKHVNNTNNTKSFGHKSEPFVRVIDHSTLQKNQTKAKRKLSKNKKQSVSSFKSQTYMKSDNNNTVPKKIKLKYMQFTSNLKDRKKTADKTKGRLNEVYSESENNSVMEVKQLSENDKYPREPTLRIGSDNSNMSHEAESVELKLAEEQFNHFSSNKNSETEANPITEASPQILEPSISSSEKSDYKMTESLIDNSPSEGIHSDESILKNNNEDDDVKHNIAIPTLYRQEGDAVFTFEKSPDYKEYNEERVRLQME